MNRVETIMAAVATALTGLATTGARVQRLKVWPLDTLPALSIYQGASVVLEDDEEVLDSIMRRLEFRVVATVRGTGVLETTLNQIAAEVYAALTADRTLGLAYVFDQRLVGDDVPEVEAEQDQPVARQSMNYSLLYEHSGTSTEA